MAKNEGFVVNQPATYSSHLTWKLQDTPFPHLDKDNHGGFIGEVIYLLVNPYLAQQVEGDRPIRGVQQSIGLVHELQSNTSIWPVGTTFYYSRVPWRRYTLFSHKYLSKVTGFDRVKIHNRLGEDNTILDKLGLDPPLNGLGVTAQTVYYGAPITVNLGHRMCWWLAALREPLG